MQSLLLGRAGLHTPKHRGASAQPRKCWLCGQRMGSGWESWQGELAGSRYSQRPGPEPPSSPVPAAKPEELT